MYVSIINGETSNHMIHEKEAAKCEGIFGMDNSAVILSNACQTAILQKPCYTHGAIFLGLTA